MNLILVNFVLTYEGDAAEAVSVFHVSENVGSCRRPFRFRTNSASRSEDAS